MSQIASWKSFSLALAIFSGSYSYAQTGDWFLNPNIGIGTNSVQGTYIRAGLDLGVNLDERLYAGVGGFYGVGQHPEHDREIGTGPFVGYVYPVFDFLSAHLREDVDYVDVRNPLLNSGHPDFYTHTTSYGIESATYAGLHFSFTRYFGFSVGYRLVMGISNSALADGRSGVVLGFSLGF